MSQVYLPWEVVRRFPEVAHRLWVPEDDGRCFFCAIEPLFKSNPPQARIKRIRQRGRDRRHFGSAAGAVRAGAWNEMGRCEGGNFRTASGKNVAISAGGSYWSMWKDKKFWISFIVDHIIISRRKVFICMKIFGQGFGFPRLHHSNPPKVQGEACISYEMRAFLTSMRHPSAFVKISASVFAAIRDKRPFAREYGNNVHPWP